MIQPAGRPLAAIAALLSSLALEGCDTGVYSRQQVSGDRVAALYRDRAIVQAVPEPAPAIVAQYELPDSVVRFGLSDPRAIGAGPPPSCHVAIADHTDRAIHRFDLTGSYRGSLYQRNIPSPFASVVSIAMDDSRMIISRLARSEIAIVGSSGDVVGTLHPTPLSDSLVPRSQVVLGPEGTVLEHWFASSFHTWSASWKSELPLIRWFSESGTLLGQSGSIQRYEGKTLTAAMNRGFVGLARDTVWFAGAADSRVRGVPIHALPGETARMVELPVSFRMDPPIEYVDRRTGRAFSRVQFHLTSFAVSPDGSSFAVGHVLGWPSAQDAAALFRPRTALGIYRRAQQEFRTYDLGGEIFEVLMPSSGIVLALLRDSSLARRVVRAYLVPHGSGNAGPACRPPGG